MTTKQKPVYAILVFLSCIRLQGQNVAIELGYPQAWPEITNALTIVVEGVACKHLYVSTDNGRIISGDKSCSYSYIPKKIVESHLFIYNTANHDTVLIEKRRIAIRRWPDQPAEFARLTSGTISRGEFLAERGVYARISGFDMDGHHEVKSYEIKVIRQGEVILALTNTGGEFEPTNGRKLDIVQAGDEILFEKIMAIIPGEDKPRRLNDIRIKIQN